METMNSLVIVGATVLLLALCGVIAGVALPFRPMIVPFAWAALLGATLAVSGPVIALARWLIGNKR